MNFVLKNFVPISVALLVLCVGLYQFSFWESFPYNAMSYLSFQEFATSGINVLIYSIVSACLGVFFYRFFLLPSVNEEIGLPVFRINQGGSFPRAPLKSTTSKFFMRIKNIQIGRFYIEIEKITIWIPLVFMSIVVTLFVFEQESLCVPVCCIAVFLFVTDILIRFRLFRSYFRNKETWLKAVVVATIVPIVSIGAGFYKASLIMTGESYDYTYIVNKQKQMVKIKVLAKSQDCIVLCSMDNKTVIIYRVGELPYLPIRHFAK